MRLSPSDRSLRKWLANAPEDVLIEIDREIVRREGLRGFARLAWHVLEPVAKLKWGYALDALADHIEAVLRGEIMRLLMNVPPGLMKSLLLAVMSPAYEWGPLDRAYLSWVVATYAQPLSTRDSRKCRNLIVSDWYRKRWPDVIIASDQNEKMKFENTRRGFRSSLSLAGQITGERGNRFVFDDPHNVKDAESETKREERVQTFREAVTTRLNDPAKDPIIGIMQRVHESDVAGEILKQDLGYVHLMLPMEFEPDRRCYSPVKPTRYGSIRQEVTYSPRAQAWKPIEEFDDDETKTLAEAETIKVEKRWLVDWRTEEGQLLFPERFPRWVVERDKKAMGQYATAGQLQQRPGSRKGVIFQRGWFEIVKLEQIPLPKTTVRRWDLAATEEAIGNDPDATASVKMSLGADGRYYVEHVTEDRLSSAAVEKLIKTLATQDGPAVRIGIPQDPGQAGKSQAKYLVRQLPQFSVSVELENKKLGSKGSRAGPYASQAEAGNIVLVEGDWNTKFIDQHVIFPRGAHDDMIDCATGAFRMLTVYATAGLLDFYAQQAHGRAGAQEKR